MADNYDRYEHEGGGGFMMGLLTGTVLGAGLGMLLAPKAGSELRGTLGEQARHFGSKASEQYRKASESAGSWTGKARDAMERGHEGSQETRGYAGTTTSGTTGSTGSTYGGTTGSTGGTSFGSGSSSGTGGDFGRS